MLGLFGFPGFLLAVTLGLSGSREGEKQKGGTVFHKDRASCDFADQGKHVLPCQDGKITFEVEPRPPQCRPCTIIVCCRLLLDTRDTMTKKFIQGLLKVHRIYTRYWE